MPRITIEYGDDEQAEARKAMEASDLAASLRCIDRLCHDAMDHCELTKAERMRLEAICEMVPSFVRES